MWFMLASLCSLLPVDMFLKGNPVYAETALARLDSSSLHKVFEVNAFGPILVSKVTAINLATVGRVLAECCATTRLPCAAVH